MENALKGLDEDDLGLAILTTLFKVLFLISTLFKTLSFNIIKKICFLKLNFQLRHRGFFSLMKEALGIILLFFKKSFVTFPLTLKRVTAKKEKHL